ncbi:MAG: bifunctional diaminohydroxyphosphoribosylaminopyrimidine deaminase/5-amino-6-(5-phosphoribosylamino)uracil reductase RibD [Acidimicrobiia bacterium]
MGERGRFVRRVASTILGRSEAEDVMRELVAESRRTHPHPNPRVAAAIISPTGDTVAHGVHRRSGEPHAERLATGGDRYPGHAMVVTLEPCSHTGRTPPCTDAILEAGIAEVWVGATDPDPRVSGAGLSILRDAGISVHEGILSDLVESNDRGYFHQRRTGRAFVTLKLASTLDGQVAATDGTSQWITGTTAREDVHELRAAHDAVLVGSGTVNQDNPLLNVRLEGFSGPQPRPVIVAGSTPLDEGAAVLTRDPLIYSDGAGVDLLAMLEDLPNSGILSVLAEGGPAVAASLVRQGLVDEVVWYLGAALAGGEGMPAIAGKWATLSDATRLSFTDIRRIGDDIRITAKIVRT